MTRKEAAKEHRLHALASYRAEVKAGLRTKPKRKPELTRTLAATLDGSFGPDRDKRIVITLHPDGRIELRPERTRRSETLHVLDAYRFAMRCRVNRSVLEKARLAKERRAIRLAAQRQDRAEKRLLRPA